MDKLVYTAAAGLKSHMAAQAAIANNMANVSTIGFRADRINFDSMLISSNGESMDTRQPGAEAVTDIDRSAGTLMNTGRSLDVAVTSDSWIGVQASDGSEAYTRRGDLSIAPSGVLQNGEGVPVMGQGGVITLPPADKVMIGGDGTISIIPQGGNPNIWQEVDKLKLVSTKGSQTSKGLDNLLHVTGGGALPTDIDGKVTSGSLEGSNVNMTQSLVDMIENQRAYEVQANLLKEAKSMDESSASVMRLPS